MLLEIANPSDAYTIDTDDLPAACAIILFASRGAYGLNAEDGRTVLPLFLLGGDPQAWFKAEHGETLDRFFDRADSHDRMAAVLESVVVGGFAERRRMERVFAAVSDPAERAKVRAAWHDERRTSLNDIGARCIENAKRLRAQGERHRQVAEALGRSK